MIDEKKGISRSEFLKIIGGLGLAAFLAKFSGFKTITEAVLPKGAVATKPGSYGNQTYGGKSV